MMRQKGDEQMNQTNEPLHFASDYMEGAHPAVLDALVQTNLVSTTGYGEDAFCRAAEREILEACGCPDGEVRFLVGGTQTNAVVIDGLLRPWQGVVAADSGHIATHEAGAIERGGHKVLALPAADGKISAGAIERLVRDYEADENRDHLVMPGMIYLSQPTELGTLYSLRELREISAVCRSGGLALYVDGARLAYALATPENDVSLRDLAALCDAFYIGGTKCGLLFGEAVVLPKKGAISHFFSLIKQHGALLAKGRVLGVQFDALFRDGLYGRIGVPAIESAARIREKLARCGFTLPVDSPTNQIFFLADRALEAELSGRVEYGFMEQYDEDRVLLRFATSWATTAAQTDALLQLLDDLSRAQRAR